MIRNIERQKLVAQTKELSLKPHRTERAGRNSKKFRLIQICIFISGISVFGQLYLFQPLLPQLHNYFGTTVAHTSFLVSSSTIGMAAGLFFFTFNADRVSRKKLMVFSLLTSSLLTLFSACLFNFIWIIVINFVKGFVLSGVSAVALAYLTEEVSPAIIGVAISLYLSGNTVGGMLGRVVVTLVAGWSNWRMAVVAIGIEGLAMGIVFARFFPESSFFSPVKIQIRKQVRQMAAFFRDLYLLRLYLVAAFLMGSFVSVYNYLTFRLEGAPFSLPHYVIAFIFLMYTFGVGGSVVAGELSDRYSGNKILQFFIILVLASLSCFFMDNLILLIMGLGLFTFSFFGAHTIASRQVVEYAQAGRSAATSIYWLFYYVGSSILGSSTGAVLSSNGWTIFVQCLVGFAVISFLLVSVRKNR